MSYGKAQYWLINDGYRGAETQKRVKTLINYLYLFNETTLILLSRSGRKRADLSSAFNVVGISLITSGVESCCHLTETPLCSRFIYHRRYSLQAAASQRPAGKSEAGQKSP